jgi:beta-glucosidase
MIGNWSGGGRVENAISVEEGIRMLVGKDVNIHSAKGANITDDTLLLYKLNAHGGRLDYHEPGKLLREALRVARKSDVIVAVVGESQGMSGESASRSDIGIPQAQLSLLKALKKTGKPLVIVLMNGRPLTLEWENDHADAILETWFAGTEAGNAIAQVLYGESNPSGKLTATFPRNVGQIPIFYNHKNIGRPYGGDILDKFKSQYLDVANEPLFPFGYGLSYTTFSYGDLQLSTTELSEAGSLDIKLKVTNTGSYAGEEVVQLYVQDLVASVTRPVKELKAYQKITLEPGEEREVSFTLTPGDLRFYNAQLEHVTEPGDFKVYVGTNSRDVKEAGFVLN